MGAFRADAVGAPVSTAVTSSTIVVPTTGPGGSVVAGDVARLVVTTTDQTATLSAVASPGGAWTVRSGPNLLSTNSVSYLLTRTLTAADIGATLTLTFSGAGRIASQMNVHSGVTEAGLLLATRAETSADTTTTIPSVAGVPAGAMIDVSFLGRVSSGVPPDVTLPAGYSQGANSRMATTSASSSNLSAEGGYTLAGAAGSYGGESTPATSGLNFNYIVAFPASGGGGPVAPVADFTATPVTGSAPLAVQFIDASTGTPTSWAWNFGDSATSTAQSPSHTYSSAGTYTVTLTATNATGSDGETKTDFIAVTVPGALPGLIDGVEPEAHGHVPPFADGNGNLYRVTEEYAAPVEPHNTPRMMKSADGGATWVEVDAANRPADNDLESGWMLQAGTTLYYVYTDGSLVSFNSFNTSDAAANPDKWQVKSEHGITGLSAGSQQHASAVRLSDGRFRAFFSDTQAAGPNRQLAYITRSTAGAWSAKTRLTADADNRAGAVTCVGAADKTHIFYHDYANKQVLYRTLTSGDVLSAAARADATGTNTATRNYNAAGNPVYYDASGTENVTALFASASGLRSISVVGGVVQAEQVVDSNAPLISPANTDGNTGNDGPVCHLAVDGTTLHAIWTEAATGDLYRASRPHGGAWTARTLLWDAPAARHVSWAYSNVYTRGGNVVLGYTYDDGPHADNESNIYYNEVALGAPAPSDTTAPSVPAGVGALAGSATSVTVSWTASTDAVGVASYRVRRGGADVTGATAVTGTSFTDTSVSASTAYSYTVSAVDAAGNRSAESATAAVNTPPSNRWLRRTVVRALRNGGLTHTVTFAAAAAGSSLVLVMDGSDGRSVPTGWTRRAQAIVHTELSVYTKTATANESSFAVTGTISDTPAGAVVYEFPSTYTWVDAVAATDGADNPTLSGLTGTNLVFGAVGVKAAGTATYTDTAWTAPAGIVEDFDISDPTTNTAGYGFSVAYADNYTGSTFSPTSVVSGNGPFPKESLTFAVKIPDTTAPTVPSGVTATANSPTQVTVSWTASTDAVGVASYRVRRGGADLTGATAVAGTSFVDTTAAPSTAYSYTVSAVDAAGNRSAESSSAPVTTPGIAQGSGTASTSGSASGGGTVIPVSSGSGSASANANATGAGTVIVMLGSASFSVNSDTTGAGTLTVMSDTGTASIATDVAADGFAYDPETTVLYTDLTGRFLTDSGDPVEGVVVLTPEPSYRVDSTYDRIVLLRPREIRLVNGSFLERVPANGGPFGPYWRWRADVIPDGWPVPRTLYFVIPIGTESIDIADCVDGPSSPGSPDGVGPVYPGSNLFPSLNLFPHQP